MIRLIHANCTEYLPKIINEIKNPILVSDPPFNMKYHYNEYKDNMDDGKYFEWLRDIFTVSPCVITHYPESLYRLAITMGRVPEKVVSWVYNSNNRKQHRDIAFFGIKPDFRKITQPYKNPNDKRVQALIARGKTGSALYDWWNVNQIKNVSKEKTKHPCQMPLEIMKNIIGILPDDATIVDPFMGSGTTGVAAKVLNRDFVGIELNATYFEIAKKRIDEI